MTPGSTIPPSPPPPEASWPPDRIAIIGAGAMGLSLAAILGQKVPIVMVCRNQRAADVIKARGVRTTGLLAAEASPEQLEIVPSIADLARARESASNGAPTQPPELPPIIFVATKTNAIPQVAAELKPLLSAFGHTTAPPYIVSFQNGIEPGRQLIEMLGTDRVLRMVLNWGGVGGSVSMGSERSGQVEVNLNRPPHYIGCLSQKHEPISRALAALLTSAGFETRFDENIEPRVWTKGVINAAMNPIAALLDMRVGQVLDSPARTIVEALLREGYDIARARGIQLAPTPEVFLECAWDILESARTHTPSMLQDIRAGRPSEVGQLNRQIVEHASRLSASAFTHTVILALIETFDWRIYNRAGERLSDESVQSARILLGPLSQAFERPLK